MTKRSPAAEARSPTRTLYVAEPPARYLARLPLVVDASLVCALLFDEPERDDALERMAMRRLFAPRLLDLEIVQVALKKRRRGMPGAAVAQALGDYAELDIDLVQPEFPAPYELAQRYGLTAYDATYLWLAAELKAPLASFDRQLADAARQHLGALE
jgi:predicted nucleic acid-binding protein